MNKANETLIDRIIRGERSGFDDLVALYASDVLRLCTLLLRDADEANDVLQEAYLRLIRMVKQGRFYSRNGSIKGFLLIAARNLCIDRLKQRNRFYFIDPADVEECFPAQDDETPDRRIDEDRFIDAFQKALGELTEMQRTIIILRDDQDEPFKAIAESLQLPVENVKQQYYRSMKKLRIHLKPFAV